MAIYHEVAANSLDQVLAQGIKRSTHGGKSDSLILKVDEYLDTFVPAHLRSKGISRKTCVYGYIGDGKEITDIKTGRQKPLSYFISKKGVVLLALEVPEAGCYVSNLDMYDGIKSLMERDQAPPPSMASAYWNTLLPLPDFTVDKITRPEVMIPYDIPPKNIRVVRKAT